MRKSTFILFLCFIIAGILSFSCRKKDATPPDIVLIGADTMAIALKSTFIDPGATAIDNVDGKVEVVVSGSVNTNSSGEYVLTYSATDAAGNIASRIRVVIVDAALYVAGFYAVTDIITLGDTTAYKDTLSTQALIRNKVYFSRFANYKNAKVYATVAGATITIPQQNITCGTGGDIALRTFSGYGDYSATQVVIHYTKVTNDTIVTGIGTYIRQ